MRRWLTLALAMCLGSFAGGQSSHTPYPADSKPQAGDAFAPLREQWVRNLHDKKIDASVAQYAADGEFINPDGSSVRGTAALHRFFEMITSTYDSSLQFHSQRSEVSGTLAYDSGTYTESLILRATGKAQHSGGSYVTIYRRDDHGVWLIAEQVWTGTISDGVGDAAALNADPTVALTFGNPAASILTTGQLNVNDLEGGYGDGTLLGRKQIEGSRYLQRGAGRLVVAGVNG